LAAGITGVGTMPGLFPLFLPKTPLGFDRDRIQSVDHFDKHCYLKNIQSAGCQWLKSIILATQEADIRSQFKASIREIVQATLSQKYPT
jgi:hypothetical protein